MFKIKYKKVKYVFLVGDITKEKGDVLINWTTPGLDQGDKIFEKIHKAGGSIVFKNCLKALSIYGTKESHKTKLLETDSFLSSAGILEVSRLLHCALPNYRDYKQEQADKMCIETLNKALFRIKETQNISNPISTLVLRPAPNSIIGNLSYQTKKEFMSLLINTQTGVDEVRMVFETELEKDLYVKIFVNLTQSPFNRIMYFFNLL